MKCIKLIFSSLIIIGAASLIFAVSENAHNVYATRVGDVTPQVDGDKYGVFKSKENPNYTKFDYSCDGEDEWVATLKNDSANSFYYDPVSITYTFWANFDSNVSDPGFGVPFKKITCAACRTSWNNVHSDKGTKKDRGDIYILWHERQHYEACKTWNSKELSEKGLLGVKGRGKTKESAKSDLVKRLRTLAKMDSGDASATIYAAYKKVANDDVHDQIGEVTIIDGRIHTCK